MSVTFGQRSRCLLLPLLSLAIAASAQGTVNLNLATSNDETSTTVTVPFNSLFDASSTQKGVSIQVSSGNNVAVAQDQISCQCFRDQAGTQPLGESFNNVFPGARFSQEPVKIGSILCSDSAGLKKHLAASGAGNKVPSQPPAVTTTEPPSTTTSIAQTSTAATSPMATSTTALKPNIQPPSASGANTPTAFLRFSLSTDPSDDSSTQMAVPIDSSIVDMGGKRAAGVEIVTMSGLQETSSSRLFCQAFSDSKATEPLAAGFRLEGSMNLGGAGLQAVGAVGCAMLGGGQFGGTVGLVAS